MVEERIALVSKDEKGRIKLEYLQGSEQRIRLWEPFNNGLLETTFDNSGSVLLQKMLKSQADVLKLRLDESLREAGVSQTKETQFSDVKINKPCPNCKQYNLSRYIEAYATKNEVPIIPIYYCSNCKKQSYHITNSYLEYLVENNMSLFSDSEILELKGDRSAFVSELKGYIIRIFASKKIMSID
jgi:hypothetical protein